MSGASEVAAHRDRWEERYSGTEGYLYGTEPNDFLRETVANLPIGRALCIADGEGRNGVHLATLGHTVTSVDLTAAGMEKAAALANDRGVELTTVVADIDEFDLGEGRWDLIVSIFAHMPPPIRGRLHARVADALTDDGVFVLEAYTPDQVGRGTGGPPTPELTMSLDILRDELIGLRFDHEIETVRSVVEGPGHTGDGAVVQIVARRA